MLASSLLVLACLHVVLFLTAWTMGQLLTTSFLSLCFGPWCRSHRSLRQCVAQGQSICGCVATQLGNSSKVLRLSDPFVIELLWLDSCKEHQHPPGFSAGDWHACVAHWTPLSCYHALLLPSW